jgi:triosephosphate isomerase
MKIIAANWKMNKGPAEARQFFSALQGKLAFQADKQAIVFPSSVCLEAVSQSVKGTAWQWGSQNCYSEVKGAFTGETSAQVVKEMGGQWILIGHSERRALFQETDTLIAKKVHFVQSLGLRPMLCIGETLAEREGGKAENVLKRQLHEDLASADKSKEFAVAYEPVWAIGTGKVATPEQVKDAHRFVQSTLVELGFSKTTPILYGGSVKAESAAELMSIPNVSGFLIGGASLEPESYSQIYLRA